MHLHVDERHCRRSKASVGRDNREESGSSEGTSFSAPTGRDLRAYTADYRCQAKKTSGSGSIWRMPGV